MLFFFFQAEDGIRDKLVTGVQTCALPILVGGKPGFDGGLVDNVPVGPIEPIEAAGGRTLVLLTRTYRRVPKVPGRTYVQPSRPIGAKQFDVTHPAAIRHAYELGLQDGQAFAADT